jgi:hypothetical protein
LEVLTALAEAEDDDDDDEEEAVEVAVDPELRRPPGATKPPAAR